ncbi:MAG: F0F1 ATP synthase subunit B' [Synechococcales cyanobacterium RM1_1_8]|nr:F0F1 ATP synthase subunit B' [Synechococcales cyanobacterium RM1_1_8]
MFDIDATLPLMAVQILVLVALLNAVFSNPIGKVLDERSEFVRSNRLNAQERLDRAKQMAAEYEAELTETRKQAQKIVAEAQGEAQALASQQTTQAQQEAAQQREAAQKEIDQQKQAAMASLEQQVDQLSNQIVEKLLSSVSG